MPLSEVVENLKLSLVRLCQTFDVHVKSPLFLVENREVVIGGTLPNFRCACQVPLVFVRIVMLSLGVGRLYMVFQLYPSRNCRNTQLYSDTKDTVIYQC